MSSYTSGFHCPDAESHLSGSIMLGFFSFLVKLHVTGPFADIIGVNFSLDYVAEVHNAWYAYKTARSCSGGDFYFGTICGGSSRLDHKL